MERYGVFLKIDSAFDGLILVPRLKYPPIQSIDEYPKLGDEIEAVVLGFQGDAELEWRYVSLSILKEHLHGNLDREPL